MFSHYNEPYHVLIGTILASEMAVKLLIWKFEMLFREKFILYRIVANGIRFIHLIYSVHRISIFTVSYHQFNRLSFYKQKHVRRAINIKRTWADVVFYFFLLIFYFFSPFFQLFI